MCIIADRVGVLARINRELLLARNELARDRIGRIVAIDQVRYLGRHGDRVARRYPLQFGKIGRGREAMRDEFGRIAERGGNLHCAHLSNVAGVQTTWSMRKAPLASITSRSRPSATPLAWGM